MEHPEKKRKPPETTRYSLKRNLKSAKKYSQEHYRSRAICSAQFSQKSQNCFNFYENWHNQQLNDANFNNAIEISKK